jgi:hypothetical protein
VRRIRLRMILWLNTRFVACTYFADAVARGIGRDGADVVDAQTGLVVRLVTQAILDVLVMVHTPHRALILLLEQDLWLSLCSWLQGWYGGS